jgi:hypothetical protein
MPARVLALALAVGLGALLVGLSVARDAMPGDTIRVTERAVAGALLDSNPPANEYAWFKVGEVLHSSAAQSLGVSPTRLVLDNDHNPVGTSRPVCRLLRTRILSAAGCRGPTSLRVILYALGNPLRP